MAKISVVMGIYNCEDKLEESIESILKQTYSDWELIMCDDFSRDGTYIIAKEYEKKYPEKIRVIKNEKNLTLGPTLNRCLELVTGEYIARQDADDKSVPTRFQKQLEFLEKNQEYSAVGTRMINFNESGEYGISGKKGGEGQKKFLLTGVPFCHATIMMRKKTYEELKGYSSLPYTVRVEDLDLWFRFFEKGNRGYNLDEPLYMVRSDDSEYKRRNFKNYLNDFRTRLAGYNRLKFSYFYYPLLIKGFLSYILPVKLIKIYQKSQRK